MLLALPDSCLLALLQSYAADDQRSLFSAARAHSRLHQAAVAALHSITAHAPKQHIFQTHRQLPHLRELLVKSVNYIYHHEGLQAEGPAIVPEGSRLVSCCPGLRSLCMIGLQCTLELLSPLQGLSGLTELQLYPPHLSNRYLRQVDATWTVCCCI
jgi:hypothetical protein